MPEKLAVPLFAALTGETLSQTAEGREVIEQLQSALTPPQLHDGRERNQPSVHTVRIGDLSARLIEEAGETGQTLAITHERQLIGILIPVTPGLVEFLIEQNVSRVLANITRGELQLRITNKLTTLDEALDPLQRETGPSSSTDGPTNCATTQLQSGDLGIPPHSRL